MVCREFIHIGIGSTAESTIRHALHYDVAVPRLTTFLDTRAHIPLSEARKFSNAPAFTFIRNPWDWHISMFVRAVSLHSVVGPFRSWLRTAKSLSETFHYFTDPGVDRVGRFENLVEDLASILPDIAPSLFTPDQVRAWYPRHYALHGYRLPWIECPEQHLRSELYDDEARDLVAERDAEIIAMGGYSFDDFYDFEPRFHSMPEDEASELRRKLLGY